MKKIIMLLCLVVFVFAFPACSVIGKDVLEEKPTEEQNQVISTEEIVVDEKETEIIPISDTEKEFHLYRDNLKIHGELHLPEGEGPFPVVVFAGGFGTNYGYQADFVRMLNEQGIAGVVFDFIGTNNYSPSSGNYLDKTMFTEAADLNKVLDEVVLWPEIDSDRLFLWGHSFGGLVSTYVAAQREDDISGLILLEPSYYMMDQYRELFPEGSQIPVVVTEPLVVSRKFVEDMVSFDVYERMPDFHKEVLIFRGTVHGGEELETMDRYLGMAEDTFPNAQLVIIEGADHYFMEESGVRMTEQAIEFMREIMD